MAGEIIITEMKLAGLPTSKIENPFPTDEVVRSQTPPPLSPHSLYPPLSPDSPTVLSEVSNRPYNTIQYACKISDSLDPVVRNLATAHFFLVSYNFFCFFFSFSLISQDLPNFTSFYSS